MAGTSRKARNRIYWRSQGGERRAYGDFRDFADVGGKREALVIVGSKTATTDSVIAENLAAAQVAKLQLRRRNKVILGIERQANLAEFSAHHLVEKQRSGRVTTPWLESVQVQLETAIVYFCNNRQPLPRDAETDAPLLNTITDRDLGTISVLDAQRYASWLSGRSNGRDSTLSASTQRKYLNSLSNLYRRAASEGCVAPGYNPVQAMIDKPQDPAGRREAHWLEVPDAALLLEAARQPHPGRSASAMAPAMLHTIVGAMLLTGGRPSEVLGLEIRDVNIARRTVTFRPNKWRRLKTASSHRAVPLWPQLETLLRDWLSERVNDSPDALLFPSVRGTGMVRDLRKALDHAAVRAGWKSGEVRPYAFRHTYCAARLQTLDCGHPVSPWTVAREMGHGGRSLIDRVYGHLGEIRHRAEAVEYNADLHVDALGDRLVAVRALRASQMA